VVAQAPVAIDAVVPAIYSENFDSVVLTPELLHSVLTGEVTSWDDPAIVELNPDASLPTEPIVVALSAQARQAAFASWMSRIEGSTWSGSADLTFGSQIADADLASTEGVITLTSSFIAADQGLSVVGLVTPDFPDGFFPDDTNFGTGASQIVGQRSEDVVSVQLDPTVTAVAQQGVTDVAKPWQALTPIDVTVCAGSNVAPSRALARNMVRLNAQGQLVSLGLQVLPESVRALSSSALGTGLPVPTTMPTNDAVPAATDAPTEAPTDISPSADPTEIATPEPSAS
jgi:hypothetical protein